MHDIGTSEHQTGTSRRVLFGFPGWTQTTKPKAAPKCLQLPRELTLGDDDRMRVSPIPELQTLRHSPSTGPSTLAKGSQVELRLACSSATSGFVGVDVLATADETQATKIRVNFTSGLLLVDQRACCGQPGNGIVQSAPLRLQKGEAVELVIIVDGYFIEVFANNRTVITALVAPDEAKGLPAARQSTMRTSGPSRCEVASWQLSLH